MPPQPPTIRHPLRLMQGRGSWWRELSRLRTNNLFALLNVLAGYLLLRLPVGGASGRWISALALAGMLMPLGILSEVLFGLPPILVIVGGISMVASMAWLGLAVWRLRLNKVE